MDEVRRKIQDQLDNLQPYQSLAGELKRVYFISKFGEIDHVYKIIVRDVDDAIAELSALGTILEPMPDDGSLLRLKLFKGQHAQTS